MSNRRTATAAAMRKDAGDSTPQRIATLWCEECAAEVLMATPEEAAALAFTDLQTIFMWVELGTVHSTKTPDGLLVICPDSL